MILNFCIIVCWFFYRFPSRLYKHFLKNAFNQAFYNDIFSTGVLPPDFLPPPAPNRPPPPPPIIKSRAPQPPQLLTATGPPVPHRSPPRLNKSNSVDAVSSSCRKPLTNTHSTKNDKEKYFSIKKVRNPSKPPLKTETSSDAKGQRFKPVSNESVSPVTDMSAIKNLCTYTPEHVEKTISQPQSEVDPINGRRPDFKNIPNNDCKSFTYPDKNDNRLSEGKLFKFDQSQSVQSLSGNVSSIQSEVVELDNREALSKYTTSSDKRDKNKESKLLCRNEINQSNNNVSLDVSTFSPIQKDQINPSDEKGNKTSSVLKSSSKLPHGVTRTKIPSVRPFIDLKSKQKPFRIVQPLMGTKSLPSSLLDSPILDGPSFYQPVYLKPSLLYSNPKSELKVDPLLSPVLTQKKVCRPAHVNRSLSTGQVLVLEDWPLGTESLV